VNYDLLANLTVTSVDGVGIGGTATRYPCIVNRENWCIMIKAAGETVYTCEGKKYVCNQNNVVITPRGSSYEFDTVAAGIFSFLTFDAVETCDVIYQIPVKSCQPMLDIVQKIDHLKMSQPSLCRMSCIMETYNALMYLLKSAAPKYTPSVNQRKIQPAMDYLIQNYTRSLTNDELAAQTEYSTSHFRKLFLDVYGVSPLAYLQTLRINKAKEMLMNSVGSVSEIAASLGYANVYDFSRTFKRETGLSPSAYALSKTRD